MLPRMLGYMTSYGITGFTPGEALPSFELNGSVFGVCICYEISVPRIARRFKAGGCDFMLTISNDAWFKDSAELDFSHDQAVMRAIESRIGVARVVNGGITSFVDPLGRVEILERNGRQKMVEGTLTGRVKSTEAVSVYARVGDVFAVLATAFSIFCLAWSLFVPRGGVTAP